MISHTRSWVQLQKEETGKEADAGYRENPLEFAMSFDYGIESTNLAQFSLLDFNKKFYNSLGRAPNRCSVLRQDSGVVIVLKGNRLERLEQNITEVIVNGDSVSPIASASAGAEGHIPPKTAEQKLARKNELKAKSIFMLTILDEHLLKFHAWKDVKSLWEAIKNRFGGNKESKKTQKTILKQNYENFAASSQEGLNKTYDRFQKLISQLEIQGEVISQEDANLKLLRSIPSAWNNIALIMRNKSDLDTLSMDDLYNNLNVYEYEIKGKSSSSSNSQNVAFVSSDNSSSTNETINTAHSVSAASSKDHASTASYADDVMFSFFANQSNALQLDYEDLEHIDADDLEEMDLKWQVAMLTMKVKRFIKKTGRKMDLNDKGTVGFDRTKVKCYNCHRRVDISTTNALVVQDGIGGYYWSFQVVEGITNFALMAYTSLGSSSSDSEREALNKSNLEIIGYQIGLESLEARIVVHENNEAVYEEDIAFLKYDVQVKGFMQFPNPYIRNYMPSRPELSFDGFDDSVYMIKVSETETSISRTSKDIIEKPKTVRPSAPIIEEWDTDSDNDSVFRPKSDQTKPKLTKINFVKSGENVKTVNKENTHKQVENPRKSQSPRDNRRNWNGMMTQKLGNGFESIKKACFVFATKSGQVPVNAAKQNSPRAATSISTVRPVNTAAPKPNMNDALSTTYSYFKAHSPGNPQYTLQDQGIIDSGCSTHMTGNKSFLTNYQEIDGGFVAFGGSPKGGKITGKGKIKTGKLDFEDVYFFCMMKWIKREFSVARTPQQNRAAERNNRTLIKAARTMLADSLLPTTFWAEAVNTACYVQNRVLVTKPYNKTPYELLHGSGPDWLFDIDLLTNSMNYEPITTGNQTNRNAGIKDNVDSVPTQQYILLPLLYDSPQSSEDAVADDAGKKTNEKPANEAELDNLLVQQKEGYATCTNRVSTFSPFVNAVEQSFDNADDLPTDPLMPDLEDIADLLNTGIFSSAYDDEDESVEADLNNLETTMNVIQALDDPSWIEAMQEELIQFKLQKVWTLVDLPDGKRAIGIKWVFRNKKDERGIMDVKSAFLYGTIEEEVYVCQPPGFEDPQFLDKVYKVEKALYGLHQAPKAWYETLSTYLLENRFRRGTIDKTLFIKKDKDDILLVQVYVDDIIFGSTKKSLCVEFEQMMHKRFQMSSMGELTFFLGLQVKQKDDGIFISQDKYVADILKKFDFVTVKTASTLIETNKALFKDEEAEDVDVHLYRSMIGSLMYLTASRPDIMFAICACARFQVTPKFSHLHVVKRIFRYLKGQPKLGLWYPRDSPFDLKAFSDSDYAGASLDRKSTTGGCQFLGKRLISWQYKKQTIVANSTTEAEYVAAANCCGRVLWIQNQMLDYGSNFINTKIHIDNESTICIVKNPVFHAKTKHIEIKHHFIRDSYEKMLI
ncbi:putative ribonuclease H-like domain-containing protein [Tanacetum coccineum]